MQLFPTYLLNFSFELKFQTDISNLFFWLSFELVLFFHIWIFLNLLYTISWLFQWAILLWETFRRHLLNSLVCYGTSLVRRTKNRRPPLHRQTLPTRIMQVILISKLKIRSQLFPRFRTAMGVKKILPCFSPNATNSVSSFRTSGSGQKV